VMLGVDLMILSGHTTITTTIYYTTTSIY